MNCIICKANDWENVDRFRYRKAGMCVCKGCGFISYPEAYEKRGELLEFYKKDYRGAPTIDNLHTGRQKTFYHFAFLQGLFQAWKKHGKTKPVIVDVGCSYGVFLEHLSEAFPEGDINGVELTLAHRRNAYHEYGFNIRETIDETKRYDLISSYKVAEHIFDIDQELVKYRDLLTPEGFLYISVPVWFDDMCVSGHGNWDLEEYYHPNHVNAWTREHFERLLDQCGLEIVGKNTNTYGSTYLCKKAVPATEPAEPKAYESLYPRVIESLEKVQKAHEAYINKKFNDAITIWPNFPTAHILRFEANRAQFNNEGGDQAWAWIKANIIDEAFKACGDHIDILNFAADLAQRYEQFREAIGYCERALAIRPEHSVLLIKLANCFRQMGLRCPEQKQRTELFTMARDIGRRWASGSPRDFAQALNWVYSDNAMIPVPGE